MYSVPRASCWNSCLSTDEVTNCAFGGDDLKTLYITGGGTIYSIRTATPGRVVWPTATGAAARLPTTAGGLILAASLARH